MRINKSYKIIAILSLLMITIGLILSLNLYRSSYPNILLITIDALRANHVSCQGYKRNTSPNIDIMQNHVRFIATPDREVHSSRLIYQIPLGSGFWVSQNRSRKKDESQSY